MKPDAPATERTGPAKYVPQALGVLIPFGGSVFFKDLGPTFGGMDISTGRGTAQTPAAPSAPAASVPVEIELVPFASTPEVAALLADPAQVLAPTLVNEQAPVGVAYATPVTPDMAAQRPAWQVIVTGVVLLFVLLGIVMGMPQLRRRLLKRPAPNGSDPWARLDKIVARERSLAT